MKDNDQLHQTILDCVIHTRGRQEVVVFHNWEELMDALKTRFTISIKDICMELKCSRSWVNTYVRPYIPAIYLSKGFGAKGGMDWTRLASLYLGRELRESIWLDEGAYREFIASRLISATRQTRSVLLSSFMSKATFLEYSNEYAIKKNALESLRRDFDRTGSREALNAYIRANDNLQTLYHSYLSKDILHTAFLEQADKYKRNLTPILSVDTVTKGMTDPRNLIAVHDIKEYGDADELIYRDLFVKGAIRLEFSFEAFVDSDTKTISHAGTLQDDDLGLETKNDSYLDNGNRTRTAKKIYYYLAVREPLEGDADAYISLREDCMRKFEELCPNALKVAGRGK